MATRVGRFQVRQVERLEVGRQARRRPPADGLSPALHRGSARRQGRGGIPGCARAKRHPVARSASGGHGRRGPARSHDSQRRQRARQQPDHPGPRLHRRPGEGARAPARPGAARARVANAPDAPPRHPGRRSSRARGAGRRGHAAGPGGSPAPACGGLRRGADHGLRPAHGEPDQVTPRRPERRPSCASCASARSAARRARACSRRSTASSAASSRRGPSLLTPSGGRPGKLGCDHGEVELSTERLGEQLGGVEALAVAP